VYKTTVLSIAIVGSFGLSCSGSGGGQPNTAASKRDAQAAADTVSGPADWQFFDVSGCGLQPGDQPGYQTVAASSGTQVAFASLVQTSDQAPCTIEGRAATTAPVFKICVVLPSASGFVGTIATSQPYAAMMGVGLAFDSAGVLMLAYTGGPSAQFRCGASDMLLASVSGGVLGTPSTIAADSQASDMPPDQAANCTSAAAQNVCNLGDATGYWPAVALDSSSGKLGVAFRDLHFGFSDTDFNSSDVEFARGDAYSIFTADVARGGGSYIRLGFSPAGKAAIVHYNQHLPAIWLDHETDAGWESKQLFVGTIREQIGFAVSHQGLHALAYFDETRQLLAYRESSDGSSWTAVQDVDRDGVTGYYPSLAFDDSGNPAIAYYRCNDYGVGDGCDMNKDGLFLARRSAGTWNIQRVSGESGVSDGTYTALAFVGGKAVIAFQTSYYDIAAGTSKAILRVAKEP
jgi:hypothetical protein